MDQTKKKVLVVEDDVFLVKAYRYILEKEGMEVWVAKDGEEALQYLKGEPADIVLLDLMLPGINGFEVLAALRLNDRWKWVAVMIISNLGQSKDVEKGKELGAVEYLIKADTNIDDIIAGVKRYLRMA